MYAWWAKALARTRTLTIQILNRIFSVEFDWHFLWYALTGGWMKCTECSHFRFFMPLRIHSLSYYYYAMQRKWVCGFVFVCVVLCVSKAPTPFGKSLKLNMKANYRMWCVCQWCSSQKLDDSIRYLYQMENQKQKHCSVRWKYLLDSGMRGISIHGIFDVDAPTKASSSNELKIFFYWTKFWYFG